MFIVFIKRYYIYRLPLDVMPKSRPDTLAIKRGIRWRLRRVIFTRYTLKLMFPPEPCIIRNPWKYSVAVIKILYNIYYIERVYIYIYIYIYIYVYACIEYAKASK